MALRPTLGQQIDLALRRSIPVALAVLLMFIGILPWNTHGLGPTNANLVLIPIYYWTLYRPQLMTVWAVAAIGLLSDFFLGMLGVNMLTFLVGYRVAVAQRKIFAGAPFIVVWAGFLLMSGVAGLVQWLLAAIVREQIDFNLRPALFLYMIGAVAYPPCAYVFAWIQRRSLVRVAQ
jgi:rod shape-determining protein MreD